MCVAVMTAGPPASRRIGWRGRWRRWQRRLVQRRQLLALTERELRDIGITRCDAVREASKPLWRD